MPRYRLSNGQSFFVDKELSPEELDDYLSELEADTGVPEIEPQVQTPPVTTPTTGIPADAEMSDLEKLITGQPVRGERERDWSSFIPEPIRDIWNIANEPLAGRTGVMPLAREQFAEEHPILSGIGESALAGVTAPISVAAGGFFGGARALASRLPRIAQMLQTAGRATSVPATVGGVENIFEGETLPEKIGGGIQAILGGLGVKAKLPRVPDVPGVPPVSKARQNIANIGGDIVDKDTGEVINEALKIPVKPKVVPTKTNSTNFALKNPNVETIKQLNEQGYEATGRLDKDNNPIFRKTVLEVQEESKTRQIYNLTRGLMSVDAPFTTSAAFRQGLPWIGTRHWFNAYGKAVKSFASEDIAKNVTDKINKLPIFQKTQAALNESGKPTGKLEPSFAEQMGIKLVDASDVARGEAGQLRSNLAEKIPVYGRYVRASNRAYATFLNDLRANAAQSLYDDASALGLKPQTNKVLQEQIGEFINTSTGLGKLSIEIGTKNYQKTLDFEKNAKLLSDVFFSPRLMARNIRMLNPSTYIQAEPFVRKQYMYKTLRAIGAWWSMAGLAQLAGAEVSKDPTNADFGKIRIGNTRLDPGGGLQQYLVLGSRYAAGGTTSSTSEPPKFKPFGEGYKPDTPFSTTVDFAANKLHPVARFVTDLMRANPNRPVNVLDRAAEMAVPLFTQDIIEILQEHPELAPIVIGASSLGIGSQTYGGGPPKPSFIPSEYDFVVGRKR